ncbi:MAG: HIT domain-containing protein [Candidatus Kapabacteria bacterium]|nr:HIT domain-containing protein [Candidatus Kapabacteria bacterium]
MDILWSPWRSQYIDTFNNPSKDEDPCFFCAAIKDKPENDKSRLVVARGQDCIIMMNRYPYNGGHLLIAPKRHIGDFTALTREEAYEITDLTRVAIDVIRSISSPHAFNVGMNLGRSAGAGMPGHLHQHVIPRWDGDTGFVTAICDMKVISQAMDTAYDTFRNKFEKRLGK